MLFMAVFSFDPEDREELIKRRLEGEHSPEGVKVLGEWIDFAGGRVFRVFETTETSHMAVAAYAWSDLGIAEVIPVIKTKDALRIFKMVGGE